MHPERSFLRTCPLPYPEVWPCSRHLNVSKGREGASGELEFPNFVGASDIT
jgi:hypothetical protein